MMTWWLALVVLVGGGSSNELLDMVPTDMYWRMQKVEVSTAAMLGHLKAPEAGDVGGLLEELGSDQYKVRMGAQKKLLAMGPGIIDRIRPALKSPDAEVAMRVKEIIAALSARQGQGSIRRLMAIRTLGEMKSKKALGALRKLTGSRKLFVAGYARRAIAAIEGRAPAALALSAKLRMEDVWLLPAGCGMVAQVTLGGGKDFDLATAMKGMLPAMGRQDPKRMIREMVDGLLGLADKIGNIRVDSLTLGLADNVGSNSGFLVLVVSGLYDREKAKTFLSALAHRDLTVKKIAGVEVYSTDEGFALIFPSRERAILIAGPSADKLPIEAVAKAVASGKGGLAGEKELAGLIAKVDKTASLWAVARITKHYREELPILAPFKTMTFSVKKARGRTYLALHAEGDDPNAVRDSLAQFEKGLKEVQVQVTKMSERMDMVKGLADLLAGVKISQRGTRASITATVKGNALGELIMSPILLLTGERVLVEAAVDRPRRVLVKAARTRPARLRTARTRPAQSRTRPAKTSP